MQIQADSSHHFPVSIVRRMRSHPPHSPFFLSCRQGISLSMVAHQQAESLSNPRILKSSPPTPPVAADWPPHFPPRLGLLKRHHLVNSQVEESVQKWVAHLYPNIDNQLVNKGVPHLTEHSQVEREINVILAGRGIVLPTKLRTATAPGQKTPARQGERCAGRAHRNTSTGLTHRQEA